MGQKGVAMEFVLQQRNPVRKVTGFTAVVAFHVVIVLVFMHGLAQHRIAFTPPPNIDYVAIVDPLPPPPKTPLPTPVSSTMAPTTIPIPIPIDFPPVVVDVVTATVAETSTVVSTGPPTTTIGDQGAVSASLGAACPNAQGIRSSMRYPAQARKDGLQGEVLAQFLVAANGDIRDIAIVSSSNRAFNSVVMNAVKQFSCVAQGRDVTVQVPFSFKLE